MEAIIDQVKHLFSSADEVARKKILVGLRDLMYAIESPDDTLQRIMFLVSCNDHSQVWEQKYRYLIVPAPSNFDGPCGHRFEDL